MGWSARWRCTINAGVLVAIVFPWVMLPALALSTVDVPEVTAQSVFALDPDTGEIILEQAGETRMPIGSITKVMTALVVIEHADLDETVTITNDDLVGPGYSAMGLQPGDTLTVEQLLTGMLVVSGGDAAKALARHVGEGMATTDGSAEAVAAFVDAMNDKASELGLDDTQFANPDGEDSDEAWSTARDVATMFAALQENPTLAGMASEESYDFTSVGPEATPYTGQSTNQLAGEDGVTGAKTGSTVEAGGCVVLAREGASGVTEIVAILGSDLEYDENWVAIVDERWTDAQVVMEAIDSHWTPGQNLPTPEPTSEPKPTVYPVNDAPDDMPPQVTLDEQSENSTGGPTTAPILAATVATGVIALAGILAWSRIGAHRKQEATSLGHDTWT